MKNFFPRFFYEKDDGASQLSKSFPVVSNDLANQAATWWKYDKYTDIQRYKVLKWFGIPLLRIPYKETIEGNYFIPSGKVVKILKKMQKENIIPCIKKSSIIFEPGSNVGTNLMSLQNEYGCKVQGMDISEKAIMLTSSIWKGKNNFSFLLDNVLTTNYFKNLPDNFFDLIITKWHLIHIPFSEDKKKYIEQLKRITKSFVIFEPSRNEKNTLYKKVELYNKDEFCLSWDNWSQDYNLTEYESGINFFKDGTKIYYFVK